MSADKLGLGMSPEDKRVEELEKRVQDLELAVRVLQNEREPIIHARWGSTLVTNHIGSTDIKTMATICSNCKTTFERCTNQYKRCPECGAHMNGEGIYNGKQI